MTSVAKNILVTGGSNGIGAAIVRMYGCSGNSVFFTGRNEHDAVSLRDEVIAASGGRAAFALGDVAVPDDVNRMCSEAQAFFKQHGSGSGTIDVLVANAGCGGGRAALETTEIESFDRQFATNVKGVYLFIRAVLPGMKSQKRGQIVVTSSVAGIRPVANGAIYCSTKWAVEGMVRSLREELKGTGVKAATINPGPVATKWWDEEARGGKRPDGARPSTMLSAEDCARGAATIIDQAETSDIASVVLDACA